MTGSVRWPASPRVPARRPGKPIRVVSEGVRQDLQRDLAVELGVGSLPDLSHAALTNESGHVSIRRILRSGSKSVCLGTSTHLVEARHPTANLA